MKVNLNATASVMLKFLAKKSSQTETEMLEELIPQKTVKPRLEEQK